MTRLPFLILAALIVVSSLCFAAGLDPLRPLTADEIGARDRIRQGLLGNDPEGERAAIEARLASRTFETPEQLERRTVEAGGIEREYFLFVPEQAAGKPSPVVFALHGAGASSGLSQHWKSDYTGLAAKEGYSAVETIERLCEWNGCQGEPQLATLPDRDPTDGVTVETATWSGSRAPLVLYRMNGRGQGWPMTQDTKSGPKSQDFVPIEAFWSFLREHRLAEDGALEP